MTASTGTASTATITDVDVVRAVFGAFASGDLAAFSDLLHADATWHHHNDDLSQRPAVGCTQRDGRRGRHHHLA